MDSKIKLIIIVVMSVGVVRGSEPQCACSKFYYEEKLLEKMVRTEFTVENMKKDIEGNKDSVEKKTMEEFHRLKSALENTIQQTLNKSKANMKKDIEEAKDSIEKTVEEFHRLKSELENTVQQMLNKSEDIRPAFTARLSAHINKLGTNQPIVFDNIITNIGQAYSKTTGVFTVPRKGTYFFIATVMSHLGQQVNSEIVLNGESIVKMYSYDKAFEQGTNGVVLNLNTPNEVWVRKMTTNGENVYGDSYSSFSGFQI